MNKKDKEDKKENFSLGVKRFILELKKRKMESFVVLIFIFFGYALSTFVPLLTGKILDSLIEGGEKAFLGFTVSAVVFYLIWMGIVVFVEKFGDIFLFNYFSVKMANSVYITYTKKIFSTLVSYPVSFFKENALGKTTYSLNTGATTLFSSFQNITNMVGFPMLIIFNMFFLFFITWQGGLLILAGNIIFIIYFLLTIEKRKKTTEEYNAAKKSINNFLTENINFSIEVKKNLSEKKENRNLVKIFKENYNQKFENKLYFNLGNTAVSQLLWYVFFILFYILIIYLFKNDQITAGALLSAVLYSGGVNRNIDWFMRSLGGVYRRFHYYWRHWKASFTYPWKLFWRKNRGKSERRNWV